MKDYTPIIHTEACGKVAAWYPTEQMIPGAKIFASLFILPNGTSPESPSTPAICQHCGLPVREIELRHALKAVLRDKNYRMPLICYTLTPYLPSAR
jgi:hypothetical protein